MLESKQSKIKVKTKKSKKGILKSESFLKFDQFGSTMSFNFQGGSSTYRSPHGACISLLVMIITLIFTIERIIVLIDKEDTKFTTTMQYNSLEDTEAFTSDDGLMLAFGVLDVE